ncbi:alpha-2-macroglobulin family protein [Lascolabacillus massiliensis]|uniref:alpha-2-macroglobulin family protein n=1 Tax=Lascolabacillus massiliensis TaxID=1627894 RepID=UPI0006B34B27|nr:alpha-2-macroglobulin family protein [Lascolabacillus massiliensis]
MRKAYLILLLTLLVSGVFSQNRTEMNRDNYEKEWAIVADFEKKSLPKSASEQVGLILQKAIKEKNTPQVIKALIHEGKYDLSVDGQNDSLIFNNLKEMLEKSSNKVEKSVIHSMLGELYLQYYQRDQWTVNQRTELGDFLPSDMKEWTRNNFYDRITEHLNASITSEDELVAVNTELYSEIIETGKDSRRFFPSMYDFLARRAIELFRQIDTDEDLTRTLKKKNILPESLFTPSEQFIEIDFSPKSTEYNLWALETYKKLIRSLSARGLKNSVLLTDLDRIEYLSQLQTTYASNIQPLFSKLLEEWEGNEFSVEIVDKIASMNLYEIGVSRSDNLAADQKKEKLYNLLNEYINWYPDYERISLLENHLQRLTNPSFTVRGNSTFSIKKEKKVKASYRNLKSLTAKLYRIDSPLDIQMSRSGIGRGLEGKRTFISDIDIPLKDIPEFMEGETEFNIDIATPGSYILTFSSDPEIENNGWGDIYYFAVSDLTIFTRSVSKNEYEFFVVDRTTGAPVNNALVKVYNLPGNWRNSVLTEVASLNTNSEGHAAYANTADDNNIFFHAIKGDDNGSFLNRFPFSHIYYTEEIDMGSEVVERTDIFTDRSLYRPGQTVYFKAILSRSADGVAAVLTDKQVEFILRDANSRELSKQLLKSNEFGSVSGEFVLPQGLLPGSFIIESEKGSVSFHVEEYKRPTFEVTFDKIEGTYKFGEEIVLKGKAENFSGIKLQNAIVDWRVSRNQSWWWSWRSSPEHFAEGVSVTDNDGLFVISFIPEKPDGGISPRAIYSFVVEASITDINGETQTGSYTVTVGDISMILQTEMPDWFDKDGDDNIVIAAKNLDGADIVAKGNYQLFSLLENDSTDRLMFSGLFESGVQKEIKEQLSKLKSGKYRLKLESEDDRGNRIEAEKDFVLYSVNDKRPPIKTNSWFIEKNTLFSPNKSAEIIFGVSERVNLLYELWQEKTLLKREWILMNNQNLTFTFPYSESYKNGLTLILTYVKDSEFYSRRVELRPEKEDEKLNVRLDVFRDRIRPGSEEEWRISVTDSKGRPAVAELLASMYDYSLDNIFQTYPWNLSNYMFDRYGTMSSLGQDISFSIETAMGNFQLPTKNVKTFEFDRFNWFGFSLYNYGRIMFRSSTSNILNEGVSLRVDAAAPQPAPSEIVGYAELKTDSDIESEEMAAGAAEQSDAQPQVRRNFNETAFFYPQLKTDDKGGVQIAFTVPESNTRWRFRVLAHDKRLSNDAAEAFTVSQKELMVTPNIPRFLRHGDKTEISAKVSNLSDTTLAVSVKLIFFNPQNDIETDDIELMNGSRSISLESGASTDVSWSFVVPSDIDLLGIRIVAESALFSDGEQHAVAILPDRMMVIESMRMDINGNDKKSFTMESLINRGSDTETDYRLTLEFTSNPAWYAVQALPVLGQPVSDNAISWFASYYANILASHIGKTYPRVSAMVEAWKKQGGDAETLLSDLEKNSELKNILLEETPWVMEAKNESEQKEKLALLFDLNRSRNLTLTTIDKLTELQTTEGGWSWFKGFNPSVSITQYILYGFSQLKSLGAVVVTDDLQSMKSKAVSYIDAEALRRFENLKKYNRNWKSIKTISTADLEYLFVRGAYSEFPVDDQVEEMTGFYKSVIMKNWSAYGLYERSLIAILMEREGNSGIVKNILDSYREHAVISDELGMYWPNNRANVFMSQSAVTVHTFIMQAFIAGSAGNTEMDNMKRWLLKQKQTQIWESAHTTADAVYVLLNSGNDWFSDSGTTTISLGEKIIETDKGEAGTGYIKESWSGGDITTDMGRVTVTHIGNAPAWGALYRQYYENLDRISKSDGSLDIEKQLFVEESGASGVQLMRISGERQLKVGDKVVVRLTLRADRDFEFVHLKDLRASAFEPVDQVSGISWQNGIIYYRTSKDASTNFYFDVLPRGTYVFEYSVYVTRKGSYSNGITTVQCMYAPEFTSHTEGLRVDIAD